MTETVLQTSDANGVAIRWTASGSAEVVITVAVTADEGQNDAAVLSRAWTQLAQAIAQNRPAIESVPENEPVGEPASDAEAAPPGSGAWWNG